MAGNTRASGRQANDRSAARWGVIALLVSVAVAAFFRIYDLGLSAFRADEILLWGLAQRKVPPGDIFSRWFEVSGVVGQMPMPAWIMQVFLWLLNWRVTPFMARLPHALIGVATIPVAYAGGRKFGGRIMGLIFAALLTVNSFHIAMSREAYFYAAASFGYFLCFWAFWALYEDIKSGGRIPAKHLVLLAIGLFFAGYSQITGLILCAAVGLLLVSLAWQHGRKDGTWAQVVGRIIAVYAIALGPLLLVPWGLRPILQQIFSHAEYAQKVADITGSNLWDGLYLSLVQFGWGWTLWGWIILGATMTASVTAFIQTRDLRPLWMLSACVIMIVLFVAARKAAGALYEARYLLWMLPFFLAIAARGLAWPFEMARDAGAYARPLRVGGWLALTAALGWSCYPAWLQTQLTGKPTPYWDIIRWTDSRLRQGALVLVDRWFEPWNELASHPSTNVYFTFTVPNEPLDTFLQNRWRDTAQAFFEKYPDAVYLEIAKTYQDVPGIGPWEWPRIFFARHHAITNEAGLKLRQLGLANRGDYYAVNTNRVVVEFFYNTRDDVIARWKREQRKAGVLFNDGWGYAKPWQQTGDFRDWRVLGDRASLKVYNLSEDSISALLVLRGVAVGGTRRIVASNGAVRDFPSGALVTWSVDLGLLNSGEHEVMLRDVLGNASRVPLLVHDVVVEERGAADLP